MVSEAIPQLVVQLYQERAAEAARDDHAHVAKEVDSASRGGECRPNHQRRAGSLHSTEQEDADQLIPVTLELQGNRVAPASEHGTGRPMEEEPAAALAAAPPSKPCRPEQSGHSAQRVTTGSRLAYQSRTVRANNNLFGVIDDLPRVLSRLLVDVQHLATLDLSFNHIAHLPTSMSSLPSLEVLRLHSNMLQSLDELAPLSPLCRLTHLSLMHNPLSSLSEQQQPRHGSADSHTHTGSVHLRQAKGQREGAKKASTALVTYPLVRWPAQSMSECVGQSNERIGLQRMSYRLRVLTRLPQLRQLDYVAVTGYERRRAAAIATAVAGRHDDKGPRRQKSRAHPRDLAALAALHCDERE